MQAMISSPSSNSYCDEEFEVTGAILSEDFMEKLKFAASDDSEDGEIEELEIDLNDDDDFSFYCFGADNTSPIAAEDAFQDGQIRPMFPLFNRDLLLGYDSSPPRDKLPHRPPVKKVFVEARDPDPSLPPSAKEIEEEAEGPYCAWSKKAVEASPELCKKSNSTGFSKIWRFRDLLNRSNSDGRDAYVFLNGSTATETTVKKEEKVAGEAKVQSAGGKLKVKVKAKRRETTPLSAHELHYVKNRARNEGDRRKSYLPYRPVVGFFTSVNGGLSRNVHPF